MNLNIGEEYKRSLIHDQFGGSRQSGISVSAQTPNIFIFTGDSGDQYGYSDEWQNDFFSYTGEGQVGDMTFDRGNRALRDHAEDGRHIHLFEITRKAFVKYLGEMRAIDYEFFDAPDRNGENRRAIRFILERVGNSNELKNPTTPKRPSGSRGYRKPDKTERKGLVTSRVGQGWYRQALLDKFDAKCAATGCAIEEILVASHIVPWARSTDDERLDVNNGILLCPAYDALFDRHLISFDDSGHVLLSSAITPNDCLKIGVDPSAQISVNSEMRGYLKRHRELLR